MSEFTIRIEAKELSEAILALAGALTQKPIPTTITQNIVNDSDKNVTKEAETVTEMTDPVTKWDKPEPETTLTVEMLRKETAKVAKGGKKDEVKALLKEFDAGSVSTLGTSKYDAYYAKLGDL